MKGKLSDLFLSSKESVIIKPDLAVKLGLNEAIVLLEIIIKTKETVQNGIPSMKMFLKIY